MGRPPDAPPDRLTRRVRGAAAHAGGVSAEAAACAALEADGFAILARRARTPAGEIDVVARSGDLVAFVEVKSRATLAAAAGAIGPAQAARLLRAAEALLALHPDWGTGDVRFDVVVVDRAGRVRRIADALREVTTS